MRFSYMSCFRSPALFICTLLECATAAAPQSLGAQDPRPFATASRIDTTRAPTIDADLSDPAWALATVLDNFRQKVPDVGMPATERTVLRILYDADNLYFGIHAYDSAPDQIVVRSMARDGPLFTGDSISITLDPGLTRRNAYSFEVGPTGGRNDALFLNNSEELDEWDAIWVARARRVSDGWIAEIAIPFRSLSYRGEGDWGFDFNRRIRRKNEDVAWSSINPALEFVDVSEAGTLTGISNINAGLGLDVQAYAALRSKRDWDIPGDKPGVSVTGGGNAFYKITPALTGTLTLNPDFSDAPLDVRQVNTTRFSLFFPETRDFFLQDAGAFEFGGTNFSRDGDDRLVNNGRPFFSRNLGLVRGVPVSIIGGGKLSGEYAGTSIGALSVLTDESAIAPRQVLSVLRASRPLFRESRMGFVVTNGDPSGATQNTVTGGDFQYRNSNFAGSYVFLADAFYQRSFSSVAGEDDSFGAAIAFPNEPRRGALAVKEIGSRFTPALGFANRTGIRSYDGTAGYVWRLRDSRFRTFEFDSAAQFVTDLRGRLETREAGASFQAETNSADQFELKVTNYFEDVPAPFDLPRNLIVLAGRYGWTNLGLDFESSNARALSVQVEVECCDFYDGSAVEASVELSYRANEYFEIVPSYEATFIDLAGGSVDIHVLAAEAAVNFTADMQLAMQAQFDNISENFGFLARYRWEYRPGNEFFVALGQNALIADAFKAQRSELSVRLGHTLRF